MAQSVAWSAEAEIDLTEILEYYFYEVGAQNYARKLNQIFESQIQFIRSYPEIGIKTNSKNVRVKLAGRYQIIYELTPEFIYILRIWDGRQDPNRLPEDLRKM